MRAGGYEIRYLLFLRKLQAERKKEACFGPKAGFLATGDYILNLGAFVLCRKKMENSTVSVFDKNILTF